VKLPLSKILILCSSPVVLAVLLLAACGSRTGRAAGNQEAKTLPPSHYRFSLPDIPAALSSPESRARYLALHYWDNFAFADTTLVHQPDITEQAFVDFIVILPHTDRTTAAEGIRAMLHSAEAEPTGRMYEYFLELSERYLDDPNSPFRNEEYYIPVTEYILTDSRSGEWERIRPEARLGMMRKNRVGGKAVDFAYTLQGGKTERLFSIEAEYTLLYFYNPDCPNCREIAQALKASPTVGGLLETGRLAILALYPDEDLDEWRRHAGEIPTTWINAYDKGAVIRETPLYDLRAIPSLYLLDREKRVILKDTDYGTLAAWLENAVGLSGQAARQDVDYGYLEMLPENESSLPR